MDRMAQSSRSGWRRLTASVLVFALILQGIAFTLAGARLADDPADSAGFALCRHDGGAAGGGEPKRPSADGHCIFCLAGATCLDAPAAVSQSHAITFAVLSWSSNTWRSPAAAVNASARPRGPPLTA